VLARCLKHVHLYKPMGEMQDLRDEINRRIYAEMRAHGFRARKSGIHTRDLDEDSLCQVAARGQVSRLTGFVSIIANVGVHIRSIERLVSDLSGTPRYRDYPSTAMVTAAEFTPYEQIGNSMPKINWWMLGSIEEVDHQLPLIIRAVAVDGLAWAEKHRDLDTLVAHMKSQPGNVMFNDRLPVALLLAGRRDEALQVIDGFLVRGLYRTDEVMNDYRKFATRFRMLT
jgi:hypothetical protein